MTRHSQCSEPAVLAQVASLLAGLLLMTGLCLGPAVRAEAGEDSTRSEDAGSPSQEREPSRAAGEQDGQPAGAQRPDPGAGESDTDDDGKEAVLFTNQDLPKAPPMYTKTPRPRPETASSKKETAAGSTLPGPASKDGEKAGPDPHELRESIAALEDRIRDLERRRLAVQNPLLRGRAPAGEDEKEAVGGQSNVARLQWVDQELAKARLELEGARAGLSAPRR